MRSKTARTKFIVIERVNNTRKESKRGLTEIRNGTGWLLVMSPFRFHFTSADTTTATGLRGRWRRRWAHGGWTRRSPGRRTRRRWHEWRRCDHWGGDSKVFGIRHIGCGRCRGDCRYRGLHSDVGSATNSLLIVPKICIWLALRISLYQSVLVSHNGAGGLQVLDPYAAKYWHWEQVSAQYFCFYTTELLRMRVDLL